MGLFSKPDKEKEKVDLRDEINAGKIHCSMVLEIAGRPADYIKKAMQLVLDGLSKERGVKIISKKSHKPKKIQTIFSTFTEIELSVENLKRLVEIVFDYMPSSLEITEPQNLKISLSETNSIINDLTTKLHKVEAVAKRMGMENEILRKQMNIKKA